MIIDETFFVGDISIANLIPNTATPTTTNDAVYENWRSFVDKYERGYLEKIIGLEMSRQFIDYLNNEDENKEPVEKWDLLKSKLIVKWGNNKYSPIAYYVYFHFVRSTQKQATILGMKFPDDDNTVDAGDKLINAWNLMCDMNMEIYEYLYKNSEMYEGCCFDACMLDKINLFGI